MHNALSLEEGCGDAHQQEYLLRTLNKNLDMSFIKPEILRFLFANISNENYMLQQYDKKEFEEFHEYLMFNY